MIEEFAKDYFDLLVGEYAGINLTRINDFDEFYNKQILDSIEPIQQSKIFFDEIKAKGAFIDVGFGGGFPLLPLAKILPEIQFFGIETRNKKVKVVSEIANKLGLNNIKFLHSRIENVLIDRSAVCSLKAVGKVNDFLEKFNSDQDISVYFYKGPNFYELEGDQLKVAKRNWSVKEEREIIIPGTDKRYLIGFEPKNVPCGTKRIKQLVKVSDIT
ncbi:MAG: hypothetical protein CME64_06900 [Halobacteriovoraceae bacterium]|nr:hypothetical protein [Halobacteriovoraceae bacterium]|tara:strand:+ start:2263 stop:2907 length:645 start_codon:yes stop_codon:yes gene_type:complete